MKAIDMAKGIRATLSVSEARLIEGALVEQLAGLTAEAREHSPLSPILAELRRAADRVADRRATVSATKAAERRQREHRAMGQIHRQIDGFNVVARFGDWLDASRDPDVSIWMSAHVAGDVVQQAEIRRGVWNVVVCDPDGNADRLTIGGDLTETSSPAEIDVVARRILATAGAV